MKIKTNEASGVVLDWMVAKCEGIQDSEFVRTHMDAWPYSTDWSQGGPIIEREGITVSKTSHGFWEAYKRPASATENYQADSDALIAGMRCYVASKLGEEVEIPNELIGE
jgi:hypothetical protein